MRTDVFEREARELDFIVKEIQFGGLVNVETQNLNTVKSFIETLDESSIEQKSFEELSKIYDDMARIDGLKSGLCRESISYIGEGNFKAYESYRSKLENRLNSLGKKRYRRAFARTNAGELAVYGIGCIMALAYVIFSLVHVFASFNLVYAVPLVLGFVIAPDLKQLKKFKFIPILAMGVATIVKLILRLRMLSGNILIMYAIFDSLPIVLIIIVSICIMIRKLENDFGDSLILCGSYALWSGYLYLVINVAPGIIANESPWHMIWFFPAIFAVVNFITYFIEDKTYDDSLFTRTATNIASFVFILVEVLFAGAYGIEIIVLIGILIAEVGFGSKIVYDKMS